MISMNISRESIFISALRGFVKSFAVVIGIALGGFLIIIGIGAVSNTVSMPDKSQLSVSADANWNRKLLPDTTPVILRINVHGVIGTSKLKEKYFKDVLLDSQDGVLKGNRVKGILLHVNTPGGTATDSSAIYQLLKEYKEKYKVPIYAFVDGLCASGGMYISSAADQIYSTENSVIGSVGVRIGPAFNFSGAMEKVGIQSLTLTEGKNKDALNPFRPWKPGEDDSIKAILASEYVTFVNVVTENRKRLNKEELVNEYGANVFAAEKAQELGYIDNGNASYDQALAALVKAAGIKEEDKYQVLEIEPYQSILKELAENKTSLLGGKIKHIFPTGAYTTSEMSGQILYLYQP
ncbi:MAG: putative signal peptide peptidase SppA [Chlamydiae bacterium]|nr:putative signal peptide peptidase SppA [Chlamydiota bacterium]